LSEEVKKMTIVKKIKDFMVDVDASVAAMYLIVAGVIVLGIAKICARF